MEKKEDNLYRVVMRDAIEDIYLVAMRRAVDTRSVNIEFDAGRGPGPHAEHKAATRTAPSMPSASPRRAAGEHQVHRYPFFQLVTGLLEELIKKAQRAGRFI